MGKPLICYAAGMQDWTREFFTTTALDAWRRSRTLEDTLEEVAFLDSFLVLGERPQRLLDVPCGDGRHAVELARRGHSVTGVDIAPENRALAERAGAPFDFVLGDMRSLRDLVEGQFEGAYCLGNSFGYFPRAQSESFMQAVADRLATGARFVIDTATAAESILVDLSQRTWQQVDEGLTVLLDCQYDVRESRLDTTYTTVSEGRVVDTRTSHNFVFTSGEIVAMLDRVGLKTLELFSDLDGAPFELGSERLLVLAERS